MIVVYHKNNQVTKIVSNQIENIPFQPKKTIAANLMAVAIQFPESHIYWCNELYENNLNSTDCELYFHHRKMMLSFNPSYSNYFPERIGYIEQSPFIRVNKKVRYPTWQMSSEAGVIHASVLVTLKEVIKPVVDFDYFLNSLAKLCLPLGLFCYSEPKLLNGISDEKTMIASSFKLYKFVKQHYKLRWLFLLFFNELLYEKKIALFPFLNALFYKSKRRIAMNLDAITVHSALKTTESATIDVIIPTIGRKKYLYDVLCDLKKQTHLPKNVIIVEQNPGKDSVSELDYLKNEPWPFAIKHTFTHQPGACNARNIGLSQVESEWVFLADDDIRIESKFFQKLLEGLTRFGIKAVSLSCLQKGEKQVYTNIFQWGGFGSGCSMVFADSLKQCKFNMGYEFGFGEDGDFGMQLRNQGFDVLYLPEPQILHLKAPMGGFRTKPALAWHNEPLQPKPSPTVMLYQILHNTQEQRLGYKTILFFKYYKFQKIKNPIKYYGNFQKQWNSSVFWANELKGKP